jgi:VIT1/CCC1 family predicted Fe2+/Mn2+ transporter
LPADDHGPDEIGHTHADVSGGWLRAATFGAMDGLVTNVSLVAGIGAAGVRPEIVVMAGLAGLVAGAFSMALGEYASVSTQNEAVDKEVSTEHREIRDNPEAERAELAGMFEAMGMSAPTAATAAREVHRDHDLAVRVHISHELGLDPEEHPSPMVAALSSFVMFSLGAVVPLIPYLLGFDSLVAGLTVGAVGLLVAGARRVDVHRDHVVVGRGPAAAVRCTGCRGDVRSGEPAGRQPGLTRSLVGIAPGGA